MMSGVESRAAYGCRWRSGSEPPSAVGGSDPEQQLQTDAEEEKL